MSRAEQLFTPAGKEAILDAIRVAERQTSGEIRVCIEDTTDGAEVMDRALRKFFQHEMADTHQRNGVMFYLAVGDKKFAVIGDEGINKVVPEDFWDSTKEAMQKEFRLGRFTEGLLTGIELAGHSLRQYFPYDRTGDTNELPDEIIFE